MSNLRRPARVLPLLLALATPAAVAAQQGVVGYDDTPLQPGGKWRVHDSRRPRPLVVVPGPLMVAAPPSDALVLLGPTATASGWRMVNDGPLTWSLVDGILAPGRGMIRSSAEFGDLQLHIEFATPEKVVGDGQGRGNSGVFLACVFEVQVLDSYQNPTYADGQAAALYGQFPPMVNASRPPGEWQAYDITFIAPRFDGTRLLSPAVLTVYHNGILVHHAQPLWGPTAHRRVGTYEPANARGPLCLQDHGNPVRFRNVWVRELATAP